MKRFFFKQKLVLGAVCLAMAAGLGESQAQSSDSELHVIGIAGGKCDKRCQAALAKAGNSAREKSKAFLRFPGRVTLNITRKEKPITLWLNSAKPVSWNISLAAGVVVRRVYLSVPTEYSLGYGALAHSKIRGLPKSTEVLKTSSDNIDVLFDNRQTIFLPNYNESGDLTCEGDLVKLDDITPREQNDSFEASLGRIRSITGLEPKSVQTPKNLTGIASSFAITPETSGISVVKSPFFCYLGTDGIVRLGQ